MNRFLRIFAPAILLIAGLLGTYLVLLALGVNTVNYTFMIGFPCFASAVILYFRPQGTCRRLIGSLIWLIAIMFGAIVALLSTGLEGLICVVMALIPIILGTMLGGVLYVIYLRWRNETRGALNVLVLPVFAFSILSVFHAPPAEYVISNSVVINAPSDHVFTMIKSIPDISPEEIPTRLPHLLGIPKPTAAVWEENENGATRHSYWGSGVHFFEKITSIEENKRISWDFEFPEGWIDEGIEDPHVKVGGPYFDILSGAYMLEEIDGMTRLTLTTRTYDNSGLGFYAEFWHRYFFETFHEVILDLVKTRIEGEAL